MINQKEQQFEKVDCHIIGMCLNLKCQEEDCYFDEQQLRDGQKHNQCRDYCKIFDEVELILQYLIYELKYQLSTQTDQQIEILNYQRILSNLNQQQYLLISQDIQYLKIQYHILNKQKNQNQIIQYCQFIYNSQVYNKEFNQLNKKIGKKHQYTLNNNNKMISHYSIQVFYQFKLGVILLELNQYTKSQKMFNTLKKEYPKFFEDQIKTMKTNQLINQNNLAQLLLIGHSLFETKQYNSAISISDRILQIDDNNKNAFMGKIASLIMLSQYQQATQVQNNCLKTNIKKSVLMCFQGYYILLLLGTFLAQQFQFNEAMICYNDAIQSDPNYVDAYYNKANLCFRLLQYEDAINYFDKVIELDPYDADAYNNKGEALEQLNKYEQAFICFEKAVQYDPQNALAHYNKGCSLFKTQNYLDTIICYNKALQLNPTWLLPYVGKGDSLQALNQIKEAIITLKLAIRCNRVPLYINQSIKQLKNLC